MPIGVYRRPSITERLLRKRIIDPQTGCWLWLGKRTKEGYGHIQFRGKTWIVHRVSFVLSRDTEISRHQPILHDCDTPPCFNPFHLHKGDTRINQKESVERFRHANSSKDRCPLGHLYSPENTYSHVTVKGHRHRVCKVCRLQLQRKRFGREEKNEAST